MWQDTNQITPKKSLGQNFLTSPVVPTWMCDAAKLVPGDIVVEIGPGTGALTRILLERGAIVHALETDLRAITLLKETFATAIAAKQLFLSHGDARHLDISAWLSSLPPYKIIANIPYYLSGYLLRACLEASNPPKTLVFLMQKEVVTRIARDKKASLLSLSVAVYGTPAYIKTVSRGHFQPPPKVDSAILAVTDIQHQAFPTTGDREHFFAILHLGLGQKRKQLLGCLATKYQREQLVNIFLDLGLQPTVRGEDVPLKTWLLLATRLKSSTQL
jgi:16S rRNA (adenine1518-N6/adenine1519-N6)-dimethyltransferase